MVITVGVANIKATQVIWSQEKQALLAFHYKNRLQLNAPVCIDAIFVGLIHHAYHKGLRVYCLATQRHARRL